MISVCPKCAGKISLPEDVDRQADCECPLCQARYSVAEVFQQVAPAVTILGKHAGDDDELSFAPAHASEPRLLAMPDGDGPGEDGDSDVAAVLDGQASTASFDVEIDDVDDKLMWDIGIDDAQSLTNLAPRDEQADELGLDTDDFSIELQENDVLTAADARAAADLLSADDDAANVAGAEEAAGVEGVTAKMADDAVSVNEEPEKSPIEVVKPFDFKPSPGQVPTRDFSPRMPRRSRSVFAEIVKFGLGGILGLLLCQAGLWWIGQLDPLGFAPKLPDAVSFLAPKSLRSSHGALGAVEQALPMPSDDQGTSESMPPTEPLPPPETFFEPEETEFLDANRASAFPTNETADSASGHHSVEEQPAAIVESLATAEPTDDVFAESATDPLESIETGDRVENGHPLADSAGDVVNDGAADDNTVPKLGLIAEPTFSRYDVSASLEATRIALDALYAADAAEEDVKERKALLASFYDAANDLAECTAYVAPGSDHVLHEVHIFVSETSRIAATVGKIAARRLPGSTQRGVFLAGTVSDTISKDDKYQRLQLTLLGDLPQVFDLLTPATNVVARGDEVFVLGVRVARPTLEIADYTADDDGPVVWTDHIVPVDR